MPRQRPGLPTSLSTLRSSIDLIPEDSIPEVCSIDDLDEEAMPRRSMLTRDFSQLSREDSISEFDLFSPTCTSEDVSSIATANSASPPELPHAPIRRRPRSRGAATAIHRSLIRRESYEQSLEKLKSTVTKGSSTNSDKMGEVMNKHLEQFKNSVGESEFDEEFLLDIASMDQSISKINMNLTLDVLEEMERKRNLERAPSRRVRGTIIKVNAWHQKNTLKEIARVKKLSPHTAWLSSFYRCDPRWQIMRFFDEVAKEGGDVPMDEHLAASPMQRWFSKAR